MNNLEAIYKKSSSAHEFASGYLSYLCDLIKQLDHEVIASFIVELEKIRQEGGTVFVVGNGGSAGTASHMANDIGLDVMKKSGTELPFRVMSLTDNIPVITAIGNDDGYDKVFIYQLGILYKPGDAIIAISASGNSPNVFEAARWVKERNGTVLGLVGFDGGDLKKVCDLCIHVDTPHGEYGPVEDIHMIMDHLMAVYLQYKVRSEK